MQHNKNGSARVVAGADVDSAGGLGSTNYSGNSNADQAAIQSRSTATEVQRAKLLALLQQKPHTTIELRAKGIMMPGVRIFEMKKLGHTITTELITQYDEQGFLHPRCARYTLVLEANQATAGAMEISHGAA